MLSVRSTWTFDRLDEVSELCEDITVFKDGAVTKRTLAARTSKADLVRAIVGRDLEIAEHGHQPAAQGRPVLEIRGVSDATLVRDVSLTVHAGEVLGRGGWSAPDAPNWQKSCTGRRNGPAERFCSTVNR